MPGPHSTSRAFVQLGTATLALCAAGPSLVVLARIRWADTADLAFTGWQVGATQCALAVLLLGAAATAALTLRGPWRALRGRTPLRAPLVVLTAVAGLGLGALSTSPLARAATWASEHTDAAARAQARYQAWLVNDGPTPALEPAPPGARTAPTETAARMLRGQDLGPDWFDTQRPNPYLLTGVPARTYETPLSRARVSLTQHHRTGGRWHRDHLVWEDLLTFASGARAQQSLARYLDDPAATRRLMGGVPVWQGRDAAFVVGRGLYLVRSLDALEGRLGPDALREVVDAAVERARAGS